jgi:FKBP-type peptidyl-prolyl cis-trans isomerase FkpA
LSGRHAQRPRGVLGAGVLAGLLIAWPALHAQTPAAAASTAAAPRPPNPVLDKARAETGAYASDSGLVMRTLKPGTGASPAATDVVRVHYRGTFPDGREFDSSYSRGKPAEFPLNRVIKCWTEGVQRMQVGAKAKLTCPPEVAYGDRGAGGVIPPGATLVFEVELLGIVAK